jgi:adenylate cyclase class 2
MAIEIEKKFRLSDDWREQILANLEGLGAQFVSEDFEENTLYGGGILDEKRAVLRVRKIGNKTVLTYKERVENNSDIKHQTEFETIVESAEEIENIIAHLGFTKALVYEKRRKTWRLRDVEIMLDELPFGLYMEIEGSITAIAEAEMLLDAENFETEHETYPHLTSKFGVKKEFVIEARFA